MARLALDVSSEAYTTSVLLQRRVVETLLLGQRTCPRPVLGVIFVWVDAVRLGLFVYLFDLLEAMLFYMFGERDSTHPIGKKPMSSLLGCDCSIVSALGS